MYFDLFIFALFLSGIEKLGFRVRPVKRQTKYDEENRAAAGLDQAAGHGGDERRHGAEKQVFGDKIAKT